LNTQSIIFLHFLIIFFSIFSLEELQICSNNYSTISSNYNFIHPTLKRVYISNNNLTEWKSLCRLGCLFPHLETLIASDNPLKTFHSDDQVEICLSNLHTLSVDQVQISEWKDIIALTNLPRLHALRIYSAPLLKVCIYLSEKMRRMKSFLGL
jgi:Leucine-rich repeat (LRR) protein